MEKNPEHKSIVSNQSAAPSLPTTFTRFQCLPVRSAIISTNEDDIEDEEDGFQCPCCLPR